MKKNVRQEQCKNVRNMAERNEEKIWGKRIHLRQTQFGEGELKRFQQNVAMGLTISYTQKWTEIAVLLGRNTVRYFSGIVQSSRMTTFFTVWPQTVCDS